MNDSSSPKKYLGQSVERIEDATLLRGAAPYTDDIPVPVGTLHAAILRSPHAHADILSIDVTAAEQRPGVHAVLTGRDIKALTEPFLIVLRVPLDQWSLAVDRVRFVGESVVVVIAEDRYLAEDALEYIDVKYRPIEAVIGTMDATKDGAPLVHEAAGTNVVSRRDFSYGEPEDAFAKADKIVELTIDYPRNSQTPLEGFVVVANYLPGDESYDILSNFQGPFTVHPVMSKALRCKGSQLRMRSPAYSGGGFGVKQAIFPYVVLMCVASRKVGRPVKWVEDRLEHLTAAIAAPNRVIEAKAAVMNDGKIIGLHFEQWDDYGAYLRPPMPGPLYRQHGIMTGAYDVPNMTIVNNLVMTNKTPSGMVRGFGGPQIYYSIERLVHTVAVELDMDHLEIIKKNLIPAGSFPYRAAAGALIDSGDYQQALEIAERDGKLEDLQERRDEMRAAGKLYGIGYAAVVEPAQSNMGYLSTINTVEERKKAGPKGGNVAIATVNIDPLGTVSVTADSLPQGQGHGTILSQIVADELGLTPQEIIVNMERDTQRDPWSIATGNYSSRFSSSTVVSAQKAAQRVRAKLARIAAQTLNVPAEEIDFVGGQVFAKGNPENTLRFSRVAGTTHWSPGELPTDMAPGVTETVTWSAPELEPPNDKDQINTSLTYGFVFDFCGLQVDRVTGEVRIDRYVTMHDSGEILNPLLADGQVYGAFAWGLGIALSEEFVYGGDGSFLSGTFADYLCPTAPEVPEPQILHMVSPSPFTPLGAKGIAEGNVMSTPVCIANAVADATGQRDLRLPLSPSKIMGLIDDDEPPAPTRAASEILVKSDAKGGRGVTGSGSARAPAAIQTVWDTLLDPVKLAAVIPGCHQLDLVGENNYTAEVSLGVGAVRGRFTADVRLADLDPPNSVVLSGGLHGPLGASSGMGKVTLTASGESTRIDYDYEVVVTGKVVAIGGRMLDGASRVLVEQFFRRLIAQIEGQNEAGNSAGSWLSRLLKILGVGR
jgi:2-furoyl-CoA dehydrogenase large subunit|tara:strand:+ start:2481 stop:5462 length:2982 start_codon:yes stop_codon:yes gene_type:complete